MSDQLAARAEDVRWFVETGMSMRRPTVVTEGHPRGNGDGPLTHLLDLTERRAEASMPSHHRRGGPVPLRECIAELREQLEQLRSDERSA